MSEVQVFQNKKGQIIGKFNLTDRTLRKKVKHSKHLFRMRNAWGVDKEMFDTVQQMDCAQIRILDEESGRIYWITAEDFWKHSIVDIFGNEGMQYFCPREHFNIIEKHER